MWVKEERLLILNHHHIYYQRFTSPFFIFLCFFQPGYEGCNHKTLDSSVLACDCLAPLSPLLPPLNHRHFITETPPPPQPPNPQSLLPVFRSWSDTENFYSNDRSILTLSPIEATHCWIPGQLTVTRTEPGKAATSAMSHNHNPEAPHPTPPPATIL